jgi:hypothetical protein
MNRFSKYLPLALVVAAGAANAAVPAYVDSAITDSKTQILDLIGVMVPAAIIIVLAALTPGVLLKMIRKLGGKVSF